MELSELCIKTLENEGFSTVYEESRAPGSAFELVNEAASMSIFVSEGTLLVSLDNETKELLPGDRSDVPPGVSQPCIAGPTGCQYVVGEM